MSERERTFGDSIFFWLSRINAIGIFIFLAFVFYSSISGFLSYALLDENRVPDGFGSERVERGSEFSAIEIETPDGTVQAYVFGEEPNIRLGIASSGMTLIHAESGRQATVLPQGGEELLATFDAVKNADNQAVAYVARIASEQEYLEGKSRLVVGSFETLEQVTIADSVPFVDAMVLTNDGKLALVYWCDESSANLVTVVLPSLVVAQSRALEMPPPRTYDHLRTAGTDAVWSID